MKKNRQLRITVKPIRESFRDIVDHIKKREKGVPVPTPLHVLNFTDQSQLFSTLTAKRMELLRHLKKAGPISIKKLAASLKRDYKNVHSDVQLFVKLDLIKTNREKLVFVPWDSISIDLSLAA